jgi:hypothetical protein
VATVNDNVDIQQTDNNNINQWWETFFEQRHTLRVSHDQNRAYRAVHDIP